MSVSGDIAGAAARIQGGTATQDDHNLVGMYFPNASAADLGSIAQGVAPEGAVFGGDHLTVMTPDAMTDERLAGVGSTINKNDVALAKHNAAMGREDGLAAKAGGLDKTLENAEYQRTVSLKTSMHGFAGETPEQTEARLAEEARQKGEGKSGIGEMLAGLFTVGAGAFALKRANDEIGGKLNTHDDMTAKNQGYNLLTGSSALQGFNDFGREPFVVAGLDEGIAAKASLPGKGHQQQQQVAQSQQSSGRERSLPA